MAMKLNIDTGVREYEINGGEANGGGTLRFNPADPNVYERFLRAQGKVQAIEEELTERGKNLPQESGEAGQAVVELMAGADRRVKEVLSWVFGPQNDFDALLGGVNIMAVATKGERVVTNLFAALLPVIQAGAEACAGQKTGEAVAGAKANRARRRAVKD